MPVFYFDINGGSEFRPGSIVQEFSSPQAAADEAVATLPDIARFELPDGLRRDFTVDVRDGAQKMIFTATLSLVGRWVK